MGVDRTESGGHDDTLPVSSGSSLTPVIERIGRYRLERVLGKGGMGVVHAAYDPELDRLVALKVLHESRGQARLVREAQAMARLRHPNVLTVHDVGLSDDRVYVTMELIEGTTLRAWQTAAKRTWREIVTMYVAAGRGLAAAHDAGIVHRDFKPDNVLIGNDGTIRVADFGLARAGENPSSTGSGSNARLAAGSISTDDIATVPGSQPARTPISGTGDPLTTVGSVVGTPAYMAPEQHEGDTVGPAADQFAFAAALWEGLAGVRPYVGSDMAGLALAKREERRGPPPRNAPAWLLALLRRALRPNPGDRHASMTELVRALDRGLGRGRRAMIAAGAAGAAGVAALAIVLIATRSPPGPRCKLAGAQVATTWNDAARARITAAFGASDRAHAADTLPRVLGELDHAAGVLSSARIAACEATHVRGEQSAVALDRHMACLDRRGDDLRAIVTLLGAGPDPDVIDHAYESVVELQDPADCAAIAQSDVALPAPAIRAQVDDARARLAETQALLTAGKQDAAAAAIDAQVSRARELAFPPLVAETQLLRARIYSEKGDAAAGDAAYHEAAVAGAAAGDDRLIASALVEQFMLLEDEGGKPAAALERMTAAEVAVARAGDAETREEFLVARGNVYRSLGRYAEATADLETALASSEKRTGKDSYTTARIASNLANAVTDQGKIEEALALDRRAEAIWEKTLGPDHPKFGQLLSNIGLRLESAGKYEEARIELERALSIKERSMGPEHPSVAVTLNNLANVASDQNRSDDSIAYHRRALAIREKALGPEHPLTASTLTNLGIQLKRKGAFAEALAIQQRALAIREKALGPDHPGTASTLGALASVLTELGRYDEALVASKRALAIRQKTVGDHNLTAWSLSNLSAVLMRMKRNDEACDYIARALAMMEKVEAPDHPELVMFLGDQAHCLLGHGKARDALVVAERAIAIGEKNPGDETSLARARVAAAYALWEIGGDHERAAQLARTAYARMSVEPTAKDDNDELERWMKKHGIAANAP